MWKACCIEAQISAKCLSLSHVPQMLIIKSFVKVCLTRFPCVYVG